MPAVNNGDSGLVAREKINDSIALAEALDTSVSGILTKTNFITVTQNVNLDTMESDISSAKTKTDFITVTQAVNLDTMESDISTISANYLSIAAAAAAYQPLNVTLTAVADGTYAGDDSITTVGTVTSGTWNATAIDYSKGGSGLTGFTALSIAVTNTVNTRTQIAPAAGQSVRINAGGTAWEAYTPGTGGSSALSDITAATGSATINNAANAIEWQWNSLTSGNGLKISSSSTGRTNTTDQLADKALLSITNTGASSTSNVFTTTLYVSNTKTGTGSWNNGIVINNTNALNINSMPLIAVGYQGGGLYVGAISSAAGAIWSYGLTTPSTTNYALAATSTDTNINAVGTIIFRYGGSARMLVGNAGVTMGGSSTPIGTLNLFNNPATDSKYGAICLGGAGFAGISGSFGFTAGQSNGYSSSTQGTFIAFNGQTGWTGDHINCQIVGVSTFRVAYDGQLSINVNDKTAVSASAQLQIDSTTRGFLPPRMTGTQAEAISSPATGLLVYSTDGSGATITSAGWWGYTGATWAKLN